MLMILPPDAAPSLVQSICARAAARGWRPEVSAGDEQIVIACAGRGEVAALEHDLADVEDLDVVPVLSGRDYWRRRLQRKVIGWLAAGLGILCAVGIAMPAVGFLVPPRRPPQGSDLARVALSADLADNAARIVRYRGKPVLVVHRGNDHYFALGAACTHMEECQLDWDGERGQIVCPCHGCVFDLAGNVLHGPASVPLTRFRVERVDQRIVLRGETP
ncbi:MAG: Rieske (2Fe-2S) protein [Planctomycetota bacterium]